MWSNDETTPTISGLAAGTYTVTVTDGKLCTATGTVTITEPAAALGMSISSQEDVACFGEATGSVSVTGTGGTPPYRYSWNTGATTASVSNLTSGIYTVTITDDNDCEVTGEVTISQPSSTLIATIDNQTNVECFGETTGSATANATGGTPPYDYLWSTDATTATASDLAAGAYTVTVTDANGCSEVLNVTITEPIDGPSVVMSDPASICIGESASISALASGGSPGYTYSWDNGLTDATTYEVSPTETTTYTVTVLDANGCSITGSVTVTVKPNPVAFFSAPTGSICEGDPVFFEAEPKDEDATYTWSFGTGASIATETGYGPHEVRYTTDLGLASVTVELTVEKDGCISTSTKSIKVRTSAIEQIEDAVAVNPSCEGGDGQIILTADDPAGSCLEFSLDNLTWQTERVFTGLGVGTYDIYARYCEEECIQVLSQEVTLEVPDQPIVTIENVTNVLCTGEFTGSATAVVTGGQEPYTYLWSNDETTPTISGLAAGTYTVTVTDGKLCTATATVTITEPAAAMTLTPQSDEICPGEIAEIGVVVTGGTPPYNYVWSNDLGEEATATPSPTAPTNYEVTVTDAALCTAIVQVEVAMEPLPVAIFNAPAENICEGQEISFRPASPQPGVTYTWNFGEGATPSTDWF